MKFKLAMTNREIRELAAYKQNGNSWFIVGAYLIVMMISGVMGGSYTYLEIHNANISNYAIYMAIISLIQCIISIELTFGISWGYLDMIDRGRFSFGKVFLPFARRPIRNLFVAICFSLIFFLVNVLCYSLLFIGLGVFYFTKTSTQFNLQVGLNENARLIGDGAYKVLTDPNIALYAAIFALLYIVVTFIVLLVKYQYSLYTYIPYDSKELSTFDILSLSRMLMKGNKFKLFRIHFFYAFLPVVLTIILGGLTTYYLMFSEPNWIGVFLPVVVAIVLLVVAVYFAIRSNSATAAFYRKLVDQYAIEIQQEFPNFAYAKVTPYSEMTDDYLEKAAYQDDSSSDWSAFADDKFDQVPPAANQSVPGGAAGIFDQADALRYQAPIAEPRVDEASEPLVGPKPEEMSPEMPEAPFVPSASDDRAFDAIIEREESKGEDNLIEHKENDDEPFVYQPDEDDK